MRFRLFAPDRAQPVTPPRRQSRAARSLVVFGAAVGLLGTVWGAGLVPSLQWVGQPEAKAVASKSHSLTARNGLVVRDTAALRKPVAAPEAPDFVREAWARDIAARQHEREVANAFETRFVAPKKQAGKMTGEQLAALMLANKERAAAKAAALEEAPPVLLASVEMAAPIDAPLATALGVAAKEQALDESVAHAAEQKADLLTALESDLPDLGLLPSWRPAIARKSVIAPVEPAAPKSPEPVLAYARPDNPMERPAAKSAGIPWPDAGRRTAIYDVSAAVVYMPNGEKLEAHSGRGKLRDNPKYSHVKMRGATPASTYKLTMRETRFHGVEAIRLNPIDGKAPKNRTGLLAHTYLLRVPGDSSGCVVFKNYPRFLAAFKRGEINHLVVVDKLQQAPAQSVSARVASLFSHR